MKIDVITETIEGIRARAQKCRELLKENDSRDSQVRLHAKAGSYDHCADLLTEAMERATK